jgi:WD40 repeat protein
MPGTATLASAQTVYPSWSYTGSLNTTRERGTATLLPTGKVLVAGGSSDNSAELYDPATGTWSLTGNLKEARIDATALLLPNGKVLIAGGFNNCATASCVTLNSAELYDPATETWTSTGSLTTARLVHTMTMLPDGRVLVAGGWDFAANSNFNTAELYNPANGTWSRTGNLNTARAVHTATLLPSGKVLVAGGADTLSHVTNTAELFDPVTGTWTYTGNLNTARALPTATLLPNGKVLVAGGDVVNVTIFDSAELYDPATGTWSATGNLRTPRVFHTATLLSNGTVLVVGSFSDALNSAELYDPATARWTITAANLTTARGGSTATLLPNYKVLVAGGFSDKTAELYDPSLSPNVTLIDDARFFVREHYADFLNREPDTHGLAYWTNEISKCRSDTRCIHARRIGVSAAFFIEMEFQDTGYYVYRFYTASFGRQPNYTEFTADRSSVGCDEGYCFADYWVERDAFLQAYPKTMSNAEFVNKLFDTAGLTASIYDPLRQQHIQAMNAGRSNRAVVLSDVTEIPDFKNIPNPNDPRYAEIKQISQYNPAFVLMQYFGYLRRNVDRDGYDFWLDVVNNREPNNYHGMVCSFITSSEYQLRFGSVVTRSNADCNE